MQNIYVFYNLIGKNLKTIRENFGDSQETLAEKIDMSRGFISRIESPGIEAGISLDTLFKIAQKYNFDIRDFFKGYEQFLESKKEKEKISV